MAEAPDPNPAEPTPEAPAAGMAEGESARAFQVAVAARAGYGLEDDCFAASGPLLVGGESAHEVAAAMNRVREAARFPERAVWAGDLAAAALIQEILRYVISRQAAAGERKGLADAASALEARLGREAERLLHDFS
jgi:hypothetical protein